MLLPAQLATMKLGIRPGFARPTPAPLAQAPLAPPAWSRTMLTPRISGDNQNLGDCFPTACCNAVQTILGDIGHYDPLPDQDAVTAYEGMAGYIPGNPATDQGTDPVQGLAWWQSNAVAGYRLVKATPLPVTAEGEIREAIERTGGVLLCVELAIEQQNQRVWVPDGTPGSWGGHAIWADSYEGELTMVTSWGDEFYIDRSYFNAPGFVSAVWELSLAAVN